MLRGADVSIHLNGPVFTLAESQELEDQLRRVETDLPIVSYIIRYADVEKTPSGDIPVIPPDVVIYLLCTVAPAATSMFVNVLSSALWDAMKTTFSRRKEKGWRGESEATFSIVKMDEEGRELHRVEGQTSDPEIIRDLVRQALEDD